VWGRDLRLIQCSLDPRVTTNRNSISSAMFAQRSRMTDVQTDRRSGSSITIVCISGIRCMFQNAPNLTSHFMFIGSSATKPQTGCYSATPTHSETIPDFALGGIRREAGHNRAVPSASTDKMPHHAKRRSVMYKNYAGTAGCYNGNVSAVQSAGRTDHPLSPQDPAPKTYTRYTHEISTKHRTRKYQIKTYSGTIVQFPILTKRCANSISIPNTKIRPNNTEVKKMNDYCIYPQSSSLRFAVTHQISIQ